jgi:hypothetical protein
MVVVAGVACATGTPPPATATVAATAPFGPDRAEDPTASPEELTRAWVAAVEAGDWQRMISLIHPDYQATARAALPTLTTEKQSKLQDTARKLGRALASGSPVFVPAQANPTVPAHVEWYFCGEKPAGDVSQTTCAFSVLEARGRWYFLSVNNPDQY